MVAQWPYTVSITSSTDGTRSFPIDTSFEPYRREAFRHRTIPPQRQSIMMTNLVGEGTINTEGLWRREQTNWDQGAGQYSLDNKTDMIESRVYSSKGVDLFSYPYQATLLADTLQVDTATFTGNVAGGSLGTITSPSTTGGLYPGMIITASNLRGPTTFTATETSGSATLTSPSSTTGLAVGMLVVGNGIPAGTTITAISTSITLSNSATATGTAVSFTAYTMITAVSSSITLSNNATSSVTGGTFTVTPQSNVNIVRCGDYAVIVSGTYVSYYTPNTTGTAPSFTKCSFSTATYGGTVPTIINSIDANDSYCFLATNTGIWFCQIGVSSTFQLYAGPDATSGYTTGYDMVRIANDQLIASKNNRLYAFQPRYPTGSNPVYGSGPSTSTNNATVLSAASDHTNTGTWLFTTSGNHNLVAGQSFSISGPQLGYTAYYGGGTGIQPGTSSGGVVTFAASEQVSPNTYRDGTNVGFAVNDTIKVVFTYTTASGTSTIYDTGTVTAVTANNSFLGRSWPSTVSYTSTNIVVSNALLGGTATSWSAYFYNVTNPAYGLSNTYTVASTPSATTFTAINTTDFTPWQSITGGNIIPTSVSDLLMTHSNANWVWSDAVGGATLVYFAGYVKGINSSYSGCIYKSGLLGATTTNVTGVQSVSNTSVFQAFTLQYPTQALPMSPDEYPLCITSYLNFIFIGTNRGVRMAQTLSVYDPTATSTGDLKAGPIIPNMLPASIPNSPIPAINYPVTGIVGDGRFVWFTWNNYDSSSTGLGKMDLTTFVGGEQLTPAFASDIMVSGQGIINNLTWDSARNLPLFAVASKGVYTANAINTTGLWSVKKYVSSGTLVSPVFDYGIPEQKIPVFFDFGVAQYGGSSVSAYVNPDPDLPQYSGTTVLGSNVFTLGTNVSSYGLTVGMTISSAQFPAGTTITVIGTNTITMSANATSGVTNTASFVAYATTQTVTSSGLSEVGLNPTNTRGNMFQVTVNLTAGTKTTTNDSAPILHRWTLKSWPAVVQGTNIMAVLQLFKVAVVDGMETFVDPYDNFVWLENLRQNQTIVTYQEGPMSVTAIVEELDWLPHKRQDVYENGFEGDCVVTLKTLDKYVYTAPTTT